MRQVPSQCCSQHPLKWVSGRRKAALSMSSAWHYNQVYPRLRENATIELARRDSSMRAATPRTPVSLQAPATNWTWIIGLCTVAILICYADRSNVSVAILEMAKQYDWDEAYKGTVLSVFFLGYAGTQLLGGSLADQYGGKAVLTVGVVTWSLFTFVTPEAAMGGSATLFSCRILMGLGEVCLPSLLTFLYTERVVALVAIAAASCALSFVTVTMRGLWCAVPDIGGHAGNGLPGSALNHLCGCAPHLAVFRCGDCDCCVVCWGRPGDRRGSCADRQVRVALCLLRLWRLRAPLAALLARHHRSGWGVCQAPRCRRAGGCHQR